MDVMAIMALVMKGVSIAEALISAGKSAVPALTAVKNLVEKAKGGTITDEEMLDVEDQLDDLIDQFNLPIE